jgi:hypothetical protein
MKSDDEITSDELDELLDDAPTLLAHQPSGSTEMRLYVTVDAGTLHELEQRAAAQGAELGTVAADALRAGAHIA